MMRHYISPRELLILIPIAALFLAALVACQPEQQTRTVQPTGDPVERSVTPSEPKPDDATSAKPKKETDPSGGEAVRKEQ
jgi:hypothetical protein